MYYVSPIYIYIDVFEIRSSGGVPYVIVLALLNKFEACFVVLYSMPQVHNRESIFHRYEKLAL